MLATNTSPEIKRVVSSDVMIVLSLGVVSLVLSIFGRSLVRLCRT